MLFDDAQSYTTFKSSYRLSQSVTFPTPEYSLVTSAKLRDHNQEQESAQNSCLWDTT